MPNILLSDSQAVEELQFFSCDITGETLTESDYYKCVFRNCHFNDAVIQKCLFDDCRFDHCNFNNCKLLDTVLKECSFQNSTFIGVDFTKTKVNLGFEVSFKNCNLSFAVFSALKMSKSKFISCNLEEVDFAETKLEESSFVLSDLTRAIFNHTNLHQADFRGSHNYAINPKTNFLKGAQFSEPDVMNLLSELGIVIADPPEDNAENL